jgi:DNA-binding MarR family transcriptional regulator
MASASKIKSSDYQALAEFRYQIRKYLRFSEAAARAAGLEPQQHLLLLALKGLPEGTPATVGEMAERLQIQHHSTVELVDRLVQRKYVRRRRDGVDRRQVCLELTARGEDVLQELSGDHADELHTLAPSLINSLRRIIIGVRRSGRRTGK